MTLATPGAGHGLVLVRGSAKASARWLRRGLVAVAAVDLPGWTGVCLVEDRARTKPPYDRGLEVLAARPTPWGRRPSLGLFVVDGCAVVTVQPRRWRAEQRWLVWQPGQGVRRTPDLPPLPTGMIAGIAGVSPGVTPAAVAEVFRGTSGTPLDRLVQLLSVLGLPGEDLLRNGPAPEHDRIEPDRKAVRSFDHTHDYDHGDERQEER